MLHHRSENGTRNDDKSARVRAILVGRPERHGFDCPTWTLEILREVIAQGVGIVLSILRVWRLAKC